MLCRGVARISQRGVLNSVDAFSADKNSLPKAAFGYFQLYTPFIVSLFTLHCKMHCNLLNAILHGANTAAVPAA